MWGKAVSLIHGRVAVSGRGEASSIRFTSEIQSIGEPPRRGDSVVDVDGAWILPGLINAHDHLEQNHYGRLKFRERYGNATEWIDDMRPRLASDPAIGEARRHPLTERLFAGALKNLLAGVTTVAHHNPYYNELRRTLPVRVVRRYGWAHSFALQDQPAGARGEPGGDVAQRWRRTSATAPFFVHLAEGIDEDARAEFTRLESIGCLAANTVIVHGVAIDVDGLHRLIAAGAGLVWCPASNLYLFGTTAAVGILLGNGGAGAVALGSDSRLTGANDLLDELRIAHATRVASADELLRMVTSNAARMLRVTYGGRLAVGVPADLLVIPAIADRPADALLATRRRNIRLVTVGGRPLVGDASMTPVFRARSVTPRAISVDGAEKSADSALVRRIAGSPIAEPGVAVA